MTDDARAAKDLVKTLKDGESGYLAAAKLVADSDRSVWAPVLYRFSEQRSAFWREIVALGHEYGDDVDAGGSAAAGLHRGWLSLKDAVTGDDAGGVLSACITGEDHAVSVFEHALEQDLSAGFRGVVTRQHAAVVTARDEVMALRDTD